MDSPNSSGPVTAPAMIAAIPICNRLTVPITNTAARTARAVKAAAVSGMRAGPVGGAGEHGCSSWRVGAR